MAQCLGMADREEDDPLRRNSGFANTGSVLYNWLFWRVFNLAFLVNAHQHQIKDRIKICLHKYGVVLTAPDAKINTGKILF